MNKAERGYVGHGKLLEIATNCLRTSAFSGGRTLGTKTDHFDVVIGVWVGYEAGTAG